jgi:hypothetical protein
MAFLDGAFASGSALILRFRATDRPDLLDEESSNLGDNGLPIVLDADAQQGLDLF